MQKSNSFSVSSAIFRDTKGEEGRSRKKPSPSLCTILKMLILRSVYFFSSCIFASKITFCIENNVRKWHFLKIMVTFMLAHHFSCQITIKSSRFIALFSFWGLFSSQSPAFRLTFCWEFSQLACLSKKIYERKCIKGKDLVWDSMICFVGDYAIGSNVINILHNGQIKVIYWQLCIQLHELPTKLNRKFLYWMIGQWFFWIWVNDFT